MQLTCCAGSNALSYSVEARFPTITLSGTAQDLSKSLFLFFLVRLPTSGMLVHSSSVTAARPRLRSTNCCCSFGRSARCLESSASSRASLHHSLANVRHKLEQVYPPSNPPPRIHVLIHLLVNLVCLLIVRFVSRSGKQPVFVVRVLKLIRVYFRFLSSSCLSFPMEPISLVRE